MIRFWAYGVFTLIPKDILNSWNLDLGVKWKIISFFSPAAEKKNDGLPEFHSQTTVGGLWAVL